MKLKDLILDKLEVSVSQFAKEIGVSRTTIDNIMFERNKRGTGLLVTKKICKYFGVDYHDYI